jgi:oligosaccharide repeat unit polymerase
MPPSFFLTLFAIIFISILLAWVKSGSIINPVSFFILWWGLFVFISGLDLVGIRMPRSETFNLILLAMTMFSVGSITFLSGSKTSYSIFMYDGKTISNILSVNLKLKIYLYFQIFVSFALLLFLYKGVGMLKNLDPGTYRYLVYTDYGIFEGHKLLLNYIIRPSVFATAFVTLAGIYLNILPKRHLLLSVMNIFLYSIVILGRSAVILIIICSFIGFLYLVTIKKIQIKKKYIIMFAVPIVFVILLSVFRKKYASAKSGTDILTDYFIWYLTGPFTAFDYFVSVYKEGVDYNFSIVRGLLAGIEDIIEPFVRIIFKDFNQLNRSFVDILGTYRDFGGPATHHNSHYTMLFTFFVDAGITGVIFFSYILGCINSILYNSFRQTASLFNFSALILVTYLSMMGSTRWEFMYSWPWLTLIFVYFLSKKITFQTNEAGL